MLLSSSTFRVTSHLPELCVWDHAYVRGCARESMSEIMFQCREFCVLPSVLYLSCHEPLARALCQAASATLRECEHVDACACVCWCACVVCVGVCACH